MAKSIGAPAVLEILGDNIARARGRRNQTEIAEASGIDISTISDLENGRRNPSYTTLIRIAAAIGVELPDLLRGAEPHSTSRSSGKSSALETRIAALEKALLKRPPAARAKPKRK